MVEFRGMRVTKVEAFSYEKTWEELRKQMRENDHGTTLE